MCSVIIICSSSLQPLEFGVVVPLPVPVASHPASAVAQLRIFLEPSFYFITPRILGKKYSPVFHLSFDFCTIIVQSRHYAVNLLGSRPVGSHNSFRNPDVCLGSRGAVASFGLAVACHQQIQRISNPNIQLFTLVFLDGSQIQEKEEEQEANEETKRIVGGHVGRIAFF